MPGRRVAKMENARNQHALHARQAAARLKKHAAQILDDFACGRPPSVHGWQIAVDAMMLHAQLAVLAEYEELAAKAPVA
jgi:hypothetical protein